MGAAGKTGNAAAVYPYKDYRYANSAYLKYKTRTYVTEEGEGNAEGRKSYAPGENGKMRYQTTITSEDIISELTDLDGVQCLNCEDCGNIIESGERYWNINGEILCDQCLSLRYERRNGMSPY